MDEIEELIEKMLEEKKQELIEVISDNLAEELCYLSYSIMMRRSSEDGFCAEKLFEEFMKEIKK